jgi:hypothetical protein
MPIWASYKKRGNGDFPFYRGEREHEEKTAKENEHAL